jgi:hypothetical protein
MQSKERKESKETRNILFLDHQGVMYTQTHPHPGTLDSFDVEAVAVLNSILDTDPLIDIVVSSDWKTWVPLDRMRAFYLEQGIRKAPIDYTPTTETYGHPYALYRAKEIQAWLSANPVDSWIAVDDLDMRPYLSNFVWISSPLVGLCQEGARELLCLLGHGEKG